MSKEVKKTKKVKKSSTLKKTLKAGTRSKKKTQKTREKSTQVKKRTLSHKKPKATLSPHVHLDSNPLGLTDRFTADDLVQLRPRLNFSWSFVYYGMGILTVLSGLMFLVKPWSDPQEVRPLSVSGVPVPMEIAPPQLPSPVQGPMALEFSEAHSLEIGSRIQYWSSYLEQNQEGQKKFSALVKDVSISDRAPLVPNEFDCTTYVETVIALARSEAADEFVKNLIAVRYKLSHPNYFDRNHFPEADWIPNNEKAGILKDITAEVAMATGTRFRTESKKVDRLDWFKRQVRTGGMARELASTPPSEWASPIEVQVAYIPIAKVDEVLKHIPNGAVINLVHQNRESHPVIISHQGFAIRQGDQVVFRHATTGGKIRTTALKDYFKKLTGLTSARGKGPLLGINLNQINFSSSASKRFNDSI